MAERTITAALVALFLMLITAAGAPAQPKVDTARGDAMIAEYFRQETKRLEDAALAGIDSLDEWKQRRQVLHKQLLEHLGLDPMPLKTDLKATITGTVEHGDIVVENLHFQSRPGLYVTANLYRPKQIDQSLPAVLYVCGHSRNVKDGVSYGNKVGYQHHGAWFARNGYVCLTIDSLQLGEIESIHHGTYRYDMWWWNSRGYSPAGVEAWNCIRALDYLETRDDVDMKRVGVTGRSGGGAYSWWIAAVDERISAAVPVAGITDLRNHVVAGFPGRYHDGVVEGHCDCMYFVNTYGWDYDMLAAMVAPRPLLISNSDKDVIFPLDGVVRLHEKVRDIYRLYDAEDKLGLNITEGPHKDTQDLRVSAFRWFNRWLKKDDSLIREPAEKLFEPEQLRVFQELPKDEKNTKIHETFVPRAGEPSVPASAEAWKSQREEWLTALRDKTFRGWPKDAGPLDVTEAFDWDYDDIHFRGYDFTSQGPVRLRLYVMHKTGLKKPDLVVLNVLDQSGWDAFLRKMRADFSEAMAGEAKPARDMEGYSAVRRTLLNNDWAFAWVAPRGVGPTAWNQDERKQIQHRRRFMLLGQTLDGMRVFDVRRAAQALRTVDIAEDAPLWMQAEGSMAGVALYASLFQPKVARLDLWHLPPSHHDGPTLLNVMRYLDTPAAVAMAAERSDVVLYEKQPSEAWKFPADVADALKWGDRVKVRVVETPEAAGR